MNLLSIIFIFTVGVLAFIFGMILELIIDARTIRELQDENRRLRELNLELSENNPVDYVEITDKTVDPENVPNYSQNW